MQSGIATPSSRQVGDQARQDAGRSRSRGRSSARPTPIRAISTVSSVTCSTSARSATRSSCRSSASGVQPSATPTTSSTSGGETAYERRAAGSRTASSRQPPARRKKASAGIAPTVVRRPASHGPHPWTLTVLLSESAGPERSGKLGRRCPKKPSSTTPSARRAARTRTARLNEVKPVDLVVGLIDELRTPQPRPRREPDRRRRARRASRRSATRAATSPRPPRSRPGCPDTVAGVQLNRFCASGLEAVNQRRAEGRAPAGRTWSSPAASSRCSRVPMGSDGGAWAMDPETALRHIGFVPQGIGADLIATIEGFTPRGRRRLRRRARRSAPPTAWADGYFADVGRPGQGPQRPDRPRPRRAHPPRHDRREPRPGSSRRSRRSARWAASTPWRCRSTTGSRRSTTSTTPATPPASSTAPRWCAIGNEQAGNDARA